MRAEHAQFCADLTVPLWKIAIDENGKERHAVDLDQPRRPKLILRSRLAHRLAAQKLKKCTL
jgi:hypothetical protein